MARPARDMHGNREHKVKPVVMWPRTLGEEIRRFKNTNPSDVDNLSHAARILLAEALTHLECGGSPARALTTLPNGPHDVRKQILMPASLYEQVQRYRYDNSERVESDAAAIRELVWLGVQLKGAVEL